MKNGGKCENTNADDKMFEVGYNEEKRL